MNTFNDNTWPLKNLKWIFFFHKMHEHSVKLTKYFKHTLSVEIVKFSYKYFEANCNLLNITLNPPHIHPQFFLSSYFAFIYAHTTGFDI